MFRENNLLIKIATLILCFWISASVEAQETPRGTIQTAIKAHGGEENLAKTLMGSLTSKATFTHAPNVVDVFSWEETFDLPRRCRRSIKGQWMGRDFSLEYATTDGIGWIRQNGGEAKEYKGEKLPLHRNWNAVLAVLPSCLGDRVKLEAVANEKVDGREAVGVKIQGDVIGGGEVVLFFDKKTGLLVKSRRRIQHPLSREEVEGEVVYADFKEVSGVQYPHRITTYVAGNKVMCEVEITRIEFLRKIDDRLFDKP